MRSVMSDDQALFRPLYVLHFGTIHPLTVLQNLRNTCGKMLLLVTLQTISLQLTKNKISLQASLAFYSLMNSLKLQNMLRI